MSQTIDDSAAVKPAAGAGAFADYVPGSELQKVLTEAVSLLGGSESAPVRWQWRQRWNRRCTQMAN